MNKRKKAMKWQPSTGMMYLCDVPNGQKFTQPSLGVGAVISKSSGSVTVSWDKYKHETKNGAIEIRRNVRMIIAPKTEVVKKKYEEIENRSTDGAETSRSGENRPKSIRVNGRNKNNKRQSRKGENRQ